MDLTVFHPTLLPFARLQRLIDFEPTDHQKPDSLTTSHANCVMFPSSSFRFLVGVHVLTHMHLHTELTSQLFLPDTTLHLPNFGKAENKQDILNIPGRVKQAPEHDLI